MRKIINVCRVALFKDASGLKHARVDELKPLWKLREINDGWRTRRLQQCLGDLIKSLARPVCAADLSLISLRGIG